MAVAHYEYMILKMPSLDGVLKIQEDCDVGAFALENFRL
jgi:hypothetical protein